VALRRPQTLRRRRHETSGITPPISLTPIFTLPPPSSHTCNTHPPNHPSHTTKHAAHSGMAGAAGDIKVLLMENISQQATRIFEAQGFQVVQAVK